MLVLNLKKIFVKSKASNGASKTHLWQSTQVLDELDASFSTETQFVDYYNNVPVSFLVSNGLAGTVNIFSNFQNRQNDSDYGTSILAEGIFLTKEL